MTNNLLVAILVLLAASIVQLVLLHRRRITISDVQKAFADVNAAQDRIERTVRDEIARNRSESSESARQSREELGSTLRAVGEALNQQLLALTQGSDQNLASMRDTVELRLQAIQKENTNKLEQLRQDSLSTAKGMREEMGTTLKGFNDSLVSNIGEIAKVQQLQLKMFSDRLEKLTQSSDQKLGSMRDTIEQRLGFLQEENGKKLDQMRQEVTVAAQKTREEVTDSLRTFSELFGRTLAEMGDSQRIKLGNVLEELIRLTEATEKKLAEQRTTIDERLKQIQADNATHSSQMRDGLSNALRALNESVLSGMTGMAGVQQNQMEAFSAQIGTLTESNRQKLEELRATVEQKLKSIQEDNSKQLEQIRTTVDEKLQGTLEHRLGESFKQVSERLEAVYRGLGEMQILAAGVGDLKKVLTNVKTRGTWGEIQLGALLEQVLNPDQYAINVAMKDGGERVEYAVKFPGRGEDRDEIVWVPIDAKFPIETYQRLVDAQEKAEPDAAESAAKQLEARVKACALEISSKYLNPPKTTDFGILFLPVEGLFAEVIRRTGLCDVIQREYRVVIAGPTTLWSLLNSLQMGFRTLAIQKRSSEVWNLLAAVKTEWSKYGEILDKVQKKLGEASNTIEDAARRSRAIGRKLRDVQELPSNEVQSVLMLGSAEIDDAELTALPQA